MTIALTTPYDPGSLDGGASYSHAEVIDASFATQAKRINLAYAYGTLSGGVFTKGKAETVSKVIEDRDGGTDFTDFEAILATGSTEKCVDAYKRALCQWLIDKGHEAGTVV